MPQIVKSWQELADVLIDTKELDPVYDWLFLVKTMKGYYWATRFLTHFLMYYDLGEAVNVAETTDDETFWEYETEYYPVFKRGHERRHSRGDIGRKYMENLSKRGRPSDIWDSMYAPQYPGLVSNVREQFDACGIGPYFIWKIMDLFDRGLDQRVDLSYEHAVMFLPEQPRKCATLMFPGRPIHVTLADVASYINRKPAPGAMTRKCSYPEAETILCAMKGFFITNSYQIGSDLARRWYELNKHPELQKLLPPMLSEEYVRG